MKRYGWSSFLPFFRGQPQLIVAISAVSTAAGRSGWASSPTRAKQIPGTSQSNREMPTPPLTQNEYPFLLLRVKEATKIKNNRQEEDKRWNCNHWDCITAGKRTVESPAPKLPSDVHLKGKQKQTMKASTCEHSGLKTCKCSSATSENCTSTDRPPEASKYLEMLKQTI